MSEAGPSPSPNISGLVDALDARARQAGAEGAASLVRGMLGTLSESLVALEQRLDRIETAVGADRDRDVLEPVQSNLSVLNGRLARLEEAFLQAVEDSGPGTQAIIDQIREAVIANLPAPTTIDSEVLVAAVRDALEGLAVVRGAGAEPVGGSDSLAEVVRSVIDERSRVIEEHVDRVAAAAAAAASAAASAAESAAESRAATSAPDASSADPQLLARLDAAIGALERDDATVRLVALVEERMNAMVRVVDERLRRLDDAQSVMRQVQESVVRSSSDLQTALDDAVERLGAAFGARSGQDRDDERVIEALRREAELLTQRVAALAVGVEATRAMCEQLAAATEQSLGRRAGEMGRRFAKDLGLLPRRGGGRSDRELGPGA